MKSDWQAGVRRLFVQKEDGEGQDGFEETHINAILHCAL
jgi:hypothetical protein